MYSFSVEVPSGGEREQAHEHEYNQRCDTREHILAMKRLQILLLATVLLVPGSLQFLQGQSLLGFDDAHAGKQRALESRFDSLLNRENLRSWMKRLSAHPHHIGSAYGKQNAEFIASLFTSWGFETEIEQFDVLFPTPKVRVVEMLEPEKFTASLTEPPLPHDATSGLTGEQLPLYNAYSADGDVTGQLVYVNYGIPGDYEELERRGIDAKGKIVIVRYGGSWRGIKPKVAAEHGAVGCLIYSDPHDDGYFEGDVYPDGAYRNQHGGQRGSVLDMPLYAGDPLTPFVGAVKNAKRLAVKDARTLMKIPVLPISYGDALPLLRAIGGPVAPEQWRGSLPITYHCGPGPATVHLRAQFSWDIVPIYDVIARLKGEDFPDEWVIRGNHHDAWVFGAQDPISGLVGMMEEARALGELVKRGWRPARTIVYCAWDGEEEGLLGSTEWAEAHADELQQKAVVYINSDSNGRGFLNVGGSHTLEQFVSQVARDVVDPEYHISVADRRRAADIVNSADADVKDVRGRNDLRISALGSGSDYTPFIQHLGIAALNIGYGGEDGGGSYHSIYDSFDYFNRFIDPGYSYGITLAQTGGRTVLRLANAPVLPFEFTNFAETVGQYIKEVARLADDMREETDEMNRRISEKTLLWAADPRQMVVIPAPKEPVPFLDFSPLRNALATLQRSTEAAVQATKKTGAPVAPDKRRALNRILMSFERSLTRAEGLPGRPWYIHQVYAPGQYTGYGVKTLPAVREAIELRQWKSANEYIALAGRLIETCSAEIEKVTSILER
jgi:N-acetylated-alpha-linked acidic dipeptidase